MDLGGGGFEFGGGAAGEDEERGAISGEGFHEEGAGAVGGDAGSEDDLVGDV